MDPEEVEAEEVVLHLHSPRNKNHPLLWMPLVEVMTIRATMTRGVTITVEVAMVEEVADDHHNHPDVLLLPDLRPPSHLAAS